MEICHVKVELSVSIILFFFFFNGGLVSVFSGHTECFLLGEARVALTLALAFEDHAGIPNHAGVGLGSQPGLLTLEAYPHSFELSPQLCRHGNTLRVVFFAY